MTIIVAPSDLYTATLEGADPGLVGIMTVEITADAGGTFYGPSPEAITEDAPGTYLFMSAAPAEPGAYTITWDDQAGGIGEEALVVGAATIPEAPSAGAYASLADFRAIRPNNPATDESVEGVLVAASEDVDNALSHVMKVRPGRKFDLTKVGDLWAEGIRRATVAQAEYRIHRGPGYFLSPGDTIQGPDFTIKPGDGGGVLASAMWVELRTYGLVPRTARARP